MVVPKAIPIVFFLSKQLGANLSIWPLGISDSSAVTRYGMMDDGRSDGSRASSMHSLVEAADSATSLLNLKYDTWQVKPGPGDPGASDGGFVRCRVNERVNKCRPPRMFHLPPRMFHLPPRMFHLPPRMFHLPPRMFHLPPRMFHLWFIWITLQ